MAEVPEMLAKEDPVIPFESVIIQSGAQSVVLLIPGQPWMAPVVPEGLKVQACLRVEIRTQPMRKPMPDRIQALEPIQRMHRTRTLGRHFPIPSHKNAQV